MKEVIVTEPLDCSFRYCTDAEDICTIASVGCENSFSFPPDCPLFENDYLIKRRSENGTT